MFIKTPSTYTVYIESDGAQRAQWLNLANVTRAEVLDCKDGTQTIKMFFVDGNVNHFAGDAAQTIIKELRKTEGGYIRETQTLDVSLMGNFPEEYEIEF